MTPLIEIKSVPIEIEMKISHAELKYTRGTADLEISKDPSGMRIKSKPIQIHMDSFQSQGFIVPTNGASESDAQGKKATYQATASFSRQEKDLMVNARIDQALLKQLVQPKSTFSAAKVARPDTPEAEMNIRYEMDKLNFDMRISTQEFEFTPGDIEFSVSQRPEVVITYVGGPIYVPPSSDPNYEPIDIKA